GRQEADRAGEADLAPCEPSGLLTLGLRRQHLAPGAEHDEAEVVGPRGQVVRDRQRPAPGEDLALEPLVGVQPIVAGRELPGRDPALRAREEGDHAKVVLGALGPRGEAGLEVEGPTRRRDLARQLPAGESHAALERDLPAFGAAPLRLHQEVAPDEVPDVDRALAGRVAGDLDVVPLTLAM